MDVRSARSTTLATREMIRAMIHFDTNFLIQATLGGSPANERFRNWSAAGENFSVSSIAWSEYLCGPLDATARTLALQIFPNPEPFLSADAALAASIFHYGTYTVNQLKEELDKHGIPVRVTA